MAEKFAGDIGIFTKPTFMEMGIVMLIFAFDDKRLKGPDKAYEEMTTAVTSNARRTYDFP